MSLFPRLRLLPAVLCRNSSIRLSSSQSGDIPEDFPPELKERPEAQLQAAYLQTGKGRIHDNKPMKVQLKKGRQYFWCTCGWSHNQPFCDGTHRNPHYRISLRPMRIVPEETRDYWLCQCKQSNRRPFCDGSHNREEVATARTVVRNSSG